MSKFKDFIIARKVAQFRKAQVDNKIPDQGQYVSLYNNMYKVLTKADAKICILEDNRSNKFAMPREKLAKLLNKSESEAPELAKADAPYGQRPKTLVREIGENAKTSSSSAAPAGPTKQPDPVGTIRNGRKKVVSKKTGKTMWVDVSSGEAHEEHDKPSEQQNPEAEQQSKQFFDSLKDKLHPADKMKLQRQFKEIASIKSRITNMLSMAHQDDRTKANDAPLTRKRVFAMQDEYKRAFESFKKDLQASVAKRKKEEI